MNKKPDDSATNNISWITLLSVVSCFAVVYLHVNGCFWQFSTEPYWISANIIESVAYFAVPCFFMISGATLIDYSKRYSLLVYLRKRFFKTVVPFFIWSIFGLCFYSFIVIKYNVEELTVGRIVNGILGTSFVQVYWFFPALFCIYLSIPLFAAVNYEARKNIFLYLIVVGCLINVLIPFLKSIWFENLIWPLNLGGVQGVLIFPILGYWIKEFFLTKQQRTIIYIFSLIGFIVHCFGTYAYSMDLGEVCSVFKGYANLPSIFYSTGIFVWFRYNGEKIMNCSFTYKVISSISQYTFGIYLIHIYLYSIIFQIIGADVTSLSNRIVLPIVIVLVSITLLWILKKIPLMKNIVP